MSIRVSQLVWEKSQAKGGARLVMLALANHAHDDGGSCWPSVETLSKETRHCERAVQYSLRKLVKLGEVAIVEEGGGRWANRYQLNLQKLEGCKPCTGEANCTAEVQPTAPQGCNRLHPNRQRTVKEPSSKEESGELVKIYRRLTAVFNRPATERIDNEELATLQHLQPVSEDELNVIERFYRAPIVAEKDRRRHTLAALLGNWSKEVDKARRFCASTRAVPSEARKVQPTGWTEWLKQQYPTAHVTDFWKVADSIRKEFTESQSLAG